MLEKNNYKKFFSGLGYGLRNINIPKNTKFLPVVHGLRPVEMPLDKYEKYYAIDLKQKIIIIIKHLFSNYYVEYRKKNPVGGKFIVGINIGPNKNSSDRVNDYKLLSQELSQFADYISINISSPNTPNLRDFHEAKQLKKVIDAVKNGLVNSNKNNIQVPIFLKIAPDIDDISLDQIIKTAHLQNLSALIISNTTIERHSSLQSKNIYEIGGLSGKPLFMKSTNLLSKANQIIKAKNYSLQLVAAGGVSDHYTAYAKILSGANLVQLYTAMTYSGPMIGDNIINGIISLMKRDKVSDLKNIRGIASDENIAIKMAKNGIQSV